MALPRRPFRGVPSSRRDQPPPEPVEAGKVIHVSVRHKGMADAQELTR